MNRDKYGVIGLVCLAVAVAFFAIGYNTAPTETIQVYYRPDNLGLADGDSLAVRIITTLPGYTEFEITVEGNDVRLLVSMIAPPVPTPPDTSGVLND